MVKLGIDVGGSGIKGALVDIEKGKLQSERLRLPTPFPATPNAIADTINQITNSFKYKGNIGIGFPAALQNGVVQTASNIDKSWIGTDAGKLISKATSCKTTVINDADVAGIAEMRYGHGKDFKGAVIIITIGTGIGTSFFTGGNLLPNTELGHVYLDNGLTAEDFTSDAVRKKEDLSWKSWAERFNKYLQHLEFLFYPELIILGGGASKKFEKYATYLTTRAKIVPALLKNEAGIIGAAASV